MAELFGRGEIGVRRRRAVRAIACDGAVAVLNWSRQDPYPYVMSMFKRALTIGPTDFRGARTGNSTRQTVKDLFARVFFELVQAVGGYLAHIAVGIFEQGANQVYGTRALAQREVVGGIAA